MNSEGSTTTAAGGQHQVERPLAGASLGRNAHLLAAPVGRLHERSLLAGGEADRRLVPLHADVHQRRVLVGDGDDRLDGADAAGQRAALEHGLERLGRAARRLDVELQALPPEVPVHVADELGDEAQVQRDDREEGDLLDVPAAATATGAVVVPASGDQYAREA